MHWDRCGMYEQIWRKIWGKGCEIHKPESANGIWKKKSILSTLLSIKYKSFRTLLFQSHVGMSTPDIAATALRPNMHGSIVRFNLGANLIRGNSVPANAPPPRLHYTTFWRSLTRRVYCKQMNETKMKARNIKKESKEIRDLMVDVENRCCEMETASTWSQR
jgi:hypothetical protein